jgi:ubiquinone biosynthesis protein
MLFRTLVTLLGTLQMIAPGYQIMEAALRVGRGVMAEQAPQNLQELLLSEAVKDAPILRRLPRELDAIARRVLHGDLRMRVSLLSEPEDVQMAKGMVNRLVMGVASAAFVLSSAILLSASSAPTLGGVRVVNLLGGVGLFISTLLLLRLVVEILRDRG